jgi:hypothetical protein
MFHSTKWAAAYLFETTIVSELRNELILSRSMWWVVKARESCLTRRRGDNSPCILVHQWSNWRERIHLYRHPSRPLWLRHVIFVFFHQQWCNHTPWQPEQVESVLLRQDVSSQIYPFGMPSNSHPVTRLRAGLGGRHRGGFGIWRNWQCLLWTAGSIAHSGAQGTSSHILKTITLISTILEGCFDIHLGIKNSIPRKMKVPGIVAHCMRPSGTNRTMGQLRPHCNNTCYRNYTARNESRDGGVGRNGWCKPRQTTGIDGVNYELC